MRYIDQSLIQNILLTAVKEVTSKKLNQILDKAKKLKGLSLAETAILLNTSKPFDLKKIFKAATFVKQSIYGNRVVMFAPLYISNICSNGCLYCAFKSDNKKIVRKNLTVDEIKEQVTWMLKRGHKRILAVAAEPIDAKLVDYYIQAIKAIYSVSVGPHKIKRVNINCAPLSVKDFKKLKTSGIGTFQIFQETYHEETYRRVHPYGPKSDPDNRITAPDRAFAAGIDDIGIGVLYGLYDYKFETLALLSHIEHMEKTLGVGPHTISVPRIESAIGASFSDNPPYRISDLEFKKIIAILRLAVPYTGLILSTRESAGLRNQLFNLGISQVSAESKTAPGGYKDQGSEETSNQFNTSDHRSLDQVIYALIKGKMIPSFCAACYRKERTGKKFMNLAKPGVIKGMCSMNALITLKEYLDDFAAKKTKKAGYKLIKEMKAKLDKNSKELLKKYFHSIDCGTRDEYV